MGPTSGPARSPAPMGHSHSRPRREASHQLVVFPRLGIKVAVQTRVIQQSQHLLILFHTWVFFTWGVGTDTLAARLRAGAGSSNPPGRRSSWGRNVKARMEEHGTARTRCTQHKAGLASLRRTRKAECGGWAGRERRKGQGQGLTGSRI